MKPESLRKRFFANSMVVTFVVMLISVFVIDISYQDELERTARDKLRLHIFSVLSVAHLAEGQLNVPVILQNPRFNTEQSGLWAAILDEQASKLWRSLSIDELPQKITLSQKLGELHYDNAQIGNQSFLTAAYKIAWDDQGTLYTFHFISAENDRLIQGDVQRFRFWLIGGFISVTFILLACQFFVLRFAFRPIYLLEEEILSLEHGDKNALSANYPAELSGVTQNLNALIDKEYRQRERYRVSMADLAHSLKTPMAIISGEMVNYSENKILQDAITRIDNSIEYQLRRAVISGHNLVSKGVHIKQVLNMVLAALQKIYVDKSINVQSTVQDELVFSGDENDFLELFGNLLDNAFKYAQNQIVVNIHVQTTSDNKQVLEIIIEDDGVGFTESQSIKIFNRGQRIDSLGLGQGIGLSVVFDLVKNYDGIIETNSSKLGGALFKIMLPHNLNNIDSTKKA